MPYSSYRTRSLLTRTVYIYYDSIKELYQLRFVWYDIKGQSLCSEIRILILHVLIYLLETVQ
jgi:hypothetical protein